VLLVLVLVLVAVAGHRPRQPWLLRLSVLFGWGRVDC